MVFVKVILRVCCLPRRSTTRHASVRSSVTGQTRKKLLVGPLARARRSLQRVRKSVQT